MKRSVFFFALLLVLALSSAGQKRRAGHLASHAGHGAAGDKAVWKQLPPPPLWDGLGTSQLPITTKSPQAQAYFNQGLRLLHCFWEFEAYRAFKEAARLDPDAAMAHWGIAMALKDEDVMSAERKKAIEKAATLAPKATEHEQFYIRAASKLLDEDAEDDKKGKDYSRELEALLDRFPGDNEARAFLALSQMRGYDDNGRPNDGTPYSQTLLRNILHDDSQSATAHHYWIHALESSSHPEDALASADALGRLAPRSGHMVHMPGHIYYRTGDYERAYQSFANSARLDESYMAGQKVTTAETWNYGHNVSYLIAACAEAGRYKEALAWSEKLRGLASAAAYHPGSPDYTIYAGSSLTRLQLRFSRWRAAAEAPMEFGVAEEHASPLARAYREGFAAYARGMAALETHQLDDAARQADQLDAMLWRLSSKMSEPESEKQSDTDSASAQSADDSEADHAKQVIAILATASLDLRGNLASARGQNEEAVRLLREAIPKEKEIGYGEPPVYARPAAESLGYVYLRARDWQKAREAFAVELRDRPKSGHALFGIAQSYTLAGQNAEATRAYREFLEAWSHADADLPEMRTAKEWLAGHN